MLILSLTAMPFKLRRRDSNPQLSLMMRCNPDWHSKIQDERCRDCFNVLPLHHSAIPLTKSRRRDLNPNLRLGMHVNLPDIPKCGTKRWQVNFYAVLAIAPHRQMRVSLSSVVTTALCRTNPHDSPVSRVRLLATAHLYRTTDPAIVNRPSLL